MATATIEQFTPEAAAYINALNSKNRQGHHNYVVERAMINSDKPLVDMTSVELKEFDQQMVRYMKWLDCK